MIIFYLIIAFTAVFVSDTVFGAAASALRKKSYLASRKNEVKRKNDPHFVISENSNYIMQYRVLRAKTDKYHEQAVADQNKFQRNVTSIAFLLFLSLSALFALNFIGEGSPTYATLLWVEVFSLAGAYYKYRKTDRMRKQWLKSRSKSEIARTFRSLLPLSKNAEGINATDVMSSFDKCIKDYLDANLELPNEFEKSASTVVNTSLKNIDGGLAKRDIISYVQTRVYQQKIWYEESEKRIKSEMHASSLFTFAIYCVTLLFAASKIVVFYLPEFHFQKEVKIFFSASLFVSAVLTGFITYYNFTRLNASLRQIYIRQIALIDSLLQDIQKKHWLDTGFPGEKELSKAEVDEFKELVKTFETSKIDEHLRWLNSRHLVEVELG